MILVIALSFMLGFLAYLVVPLAAPILDIDNQVAIADTYSKRSASAMRRFLLVEDELGRLNIAVLQRDEIAKGYKYSLHGEEFTVEDPGDFTQLFHGHNIGLSHITYPLVVDAQLLETQRERQRQIEAGKDFDLNDDQVDPRRLDVKEVRQTPNNRIAAFNPYVGISTNPSHVSLNNVARFVAKGAESDETRTIKEYTARSQRAYQSYPGGLAEGGAFMMSFLVGAVTPVALNRYVLDKSGGFVGDSVTESLGYITIEAPALL